MGLIQESTTKMVTKVLPVVQSMKTLVRQLNQDSRKQVFPQLIVYHLSMLFLYLNSKFTRTEVGKIRVFFPFQLTIQSEVIKRTYYQFAVFCICCLCMNCTIQSMHFPLYNKKVVGLKNSPCLNPLNVTSKIFLQLKEIILMSFLKNQTTRYQQLGGNGTFSVQIEMGSLACCTKGSHCSSSEFVSCRLNHLALYSMIS